MHRIKKDALFLIDASYLLYRSYYAIRPLHSPTGIPTQATYGFCRAIKKLIDKFDPQRLVVAWDSKGKTFRSEIYDAYKATRSAAPSDLHLQKEYILKFLDSIQACQIAKPGFEADDLLYSMVKENKNRQIVLVCPDKDLLQLVSDNVMIFDPFKERLIDVTTFTTEAGYPPEKQLFFYSLLGDTSDNIPGVNGIGKKTALDLVQQFDSLDDLYKNLDKVEKERTRKLLNEQKEQAFLSQKLFTLEHAPLNLTEDEMLFDKSLWKNAAPIFKELDFSSLLKDLGEVIEATIEKEATKVLDETIPVNYDWKCHLICTQHDLDKLITKLNDHEIFAVDTETTGLRTLQDDIVGMSVAFNKKESFYIPFTHPQGGDVGQLSFIEECDSRLTRKGVLEKLKPILENPKIKKTMHAVKFDKLVFYHYGINVQGVVFDCLLAANLVRNDWQKINLKDLSLFFLGERMMKFKEVLGKHKDFSSVPLEQAAAYAAHDALQTFKLTSVLQAELKKHEKLSRIFEDIEMPVCEILFKMEAHGLLLDIPVLEKVTREVEKELKKIEQKIYAAVEHHRKFVEAINLNSPKQIEFLLFEELKLPVVKKSSKGQRSTDQEVLEELSKVHPIPGLILIYRELTKLMSTYLKPLPTFVNPQTGRIHTTYSQTMVATGRLSSSDPNLQNIPASADYGIKIRSAFVAPQGKVFISADYSQIELRVLACLSKDENLINAFKHDKDIHAQTASQLFGVDFDKVTHEQRQLGKRINFSIIYGMTPYGLSKDLGIKPSEAKIYIEKYFEQYPKVAEWIKRCIERATMLGFTETWWGRRRYIPELRESNKNLVEAGKRIATNSPVQGTSAELMKIAMIRVDSALVNKGIAAHIVLQIHDELVIEVDEKDEKVVAEIVKREMEGVVDWDVPFKVSLRTGENWGDVTK